MYYILVIGLSYVYRHTFIFSFANILYIICVCVDVCGWARFADIHELSYLFPVILSLSFHLNALPDVFYSLPDIFYSLPDIFYSKDLPTIKRLLFKLVVFTTLVCVHYFVLS